MIRKKRKTAKTSASRTATRSAGQKTTKSKTAKGARTTSPANTTAKRLSKSSQTAAEKLVMRLMAISGKSGEEVEVAEFVRQQLLDAGADPKAIQFDKAHLKTPIDGKIGNMMLKLRGTQKAERRMLMAHLDTVPICVGCKPKKKGRVVTSTDPATGLGADNRAGCAVTLHTALEILRRDLPHPPLTFLWTVQEEIGLQGARHIRKAMLGSPKLAFNWDGGSPFKMTIGATGGYRMLIELKGKASHAGNAPASGVSAIAIAGLAIADLHRNGWHGAISKNGKTGTSNIGVIKGGAATNVVTDRVILQVEARSHNPTFRKQIVRAIERAFRDAVNEVVNENGQRGSVKFTGQLDYESFRLDRKTDCVNEAAKAIRATGGDPQFAITNGGLDANWMTAHGIPTVSMGCGQKNQHMVTEQLYLDEFLQACEIAMRLASPSNS